jgi:hypothetical protein
MIIVSNLCSTNKTPAGFGELEAGYCRIPGAPCAPMAAKYDQSREWCEDTGWVAGLAISICSHRDCYAVAKAAVAAKLLYIVISLGDRPPLCLPSRTGGGQGSGSLFRTGAGFTRTGAY